MLLIGLSPISPWEPWILPRIGTFVEVCSLALVAALGIFIYCLLDGLFQKRDAWLALSAILVPALMFGTWRVLDISSLNRSAWTHFFRSHEDDWRAAAAWFQTLEREDGRIPKEETPESVLKLATGGPIRVQRDRAGVIWYSIPVASQGIDNDRVFLWSKEGGEPPEEAYSQIVVCWPMGDGWYFARTT